MFNQSKITVYILFIMLCSTATVFAQSTNDIIGKADSPVYTLSWSPTGEYFATSGNNFVILWYADTNTTKTFFVEHGHPVVASNFSTDGKWFISVGTDNSVIVRSLENQAAPSRITINKEFPVKDADFIGENGFSLAVPINGRLLTGFFRLMATQDFVQRKILETHSPIMSVDTASSGVKILLGLEDGHVLIVDSNTGEVLQEQLRFTGSNIKPRFSSNGKEWIAATDRANLSISSTNRIGSRIIRDPDLFVNTAIFSPDSEHIAAAMKNGTVKIFNAETCKYERTFYLVDGKDQVLSLAYSPDGEFLIAGTKNGFIYRWSLTGKVFDEKEKKYVEKKDGNGGNEKSDNGGKQGESVKSINEMIDNMQKNGQGSNQSSSPVQPVQVQPVENPEDFDDSKEITVKHKPPLKTKSNKQVCPDDTVDITFGYNTLTDYYYGSFNFGVGYRRYEFNACYLVFDATFGAGIPNNKYPYEYRINGSLVSDPLVYTLASSCGVGLDYNIHEIDTILFSEVRFGLNTRTLCNNNFQNMVLTPPVYGFYTDLMTGFQWQSLRLSAGGEYDYNLGFLFKMEFAVCQKWRKRSAKK